MNSALGTWYLVTEMGWPSILLLWLLVSLAVAMLFGAVAAWSRGNQDAQWLGTQSLGGEEAQRVGTDSQNPKKHPEHAE